MIETLAKPVELATKTAETGKSFNIDKKIEKKEDSFFNKPKNEMYDPDDKVAKSLSSLERNAIKKETSWTDEIVNNIDSMEQYDIYKKAGLVESVVDDRICLVKGIDMDYVDPKTGMTNRQLMSKGRAPIDAKTGEKIELHHMGQKQNAPFAELCENSEHGDGNDAILHDKNKPSWRRNPLANEQYKKEKVSHWKTRATMEV